MSPHFTHFKEFMLEIAKQTEFDVASGNFSDLEIRSNDNIYYFYDAKSRRLIKSFVLREGQRVDTMCDVLLTRKGAMFTPRLTFWKKDKAKGAPDPLTEAEVIAEGRTVLIKARVDVSDCHQSFWKLISFLQTCKDVDVPIEEFRVASQKEISVLEALEGQDKGAVLNAVKTYLHGQITEADVQLLLDRRKALDTFDKLLIDPNFFTAKLQQHSTTGEGVWQKFFEANTWIFGYGLKLVACSKFNDRKLEQITSGANAFTGGGKRSDALMRTRGFVQTLLFAEIKRHDTNLLMARQYREPDVYQVSPELSGAVSQVQKTAYKAVANLASLHRTHTPEGSFQFDVSTVSPRKVVIIGNSAMLAEGAEVNVEKMTSFELYRRSHQDVEILTFDELFARSKFIVESQESEAS